MSTTTLNQPKHQVWSSKRVCDKLSARQMYKHDQVVQLNLTRLETEGKLNTLRFRPSIGGADSMIVKLNETGFRQLVGNLSYGMDAKAVPADFLLHGIDGSRRGAVVNELLNQNYSDRMLRIDDRTCYGVVSPQYRVLDHDRIKDIIQQSDVSLVATSGSSLHYDHAKVRLLRESDAYDYRNKQLQLGDHVPMVEITNSEVGLSALTISFGVYTLRCTNGLISSQMFSQMRFIHLGSQNFEVPSIGSIFNHCEGMIDKLRSAETKYLSASKKQDIVLQLQSAGVSQRDLETIRQTVQTEYHGGRTYGDVINGITRAAQVYGSEQASRRTQLERVAGSILLAA